MVLRNGSYKNDWKYDPFMILNVAGLAFYTWYEDNGRSNVELVFEFDKWLDEIIEIIDDKFCKIKERICRKKGW